MGAKGKRGIGMEGEGMEGVRENSGEDDAERKCEDEE